MDRQTASLWDEIVAHPRVSRAVLVKIDGLDRVVITVSVMAKTRPIPSNHHYDGSFTVAAEQAVAYLRELA